MADIGVVIVVVVLVVYFDTTLEQIRDALKDIAYELRDANRLRKEKR